MWLLVDDIRDSMGCDIVARNYSVAIKIMKYMHKEIVGICLDHDLGGDKTGYDFLVWLLEDLQCFPQVRLVTSNPVGRANMQAALKQNGYNSGDGFNWIKHE